MNQRTYILLLLLLGIVLFGLSIFLQDRLEGFIISLSEFADENPILSAQLFILFASLSILLGPFSSIPLVPPAIVIWGPFLTLLFLITGWLFGNSMAYVIGHYYGYTLIKKILGEKKVNLWIDKIENYLNFWFLFLFRLATPSETGYIFGLIRYDFGKYLIISILAETPFALAAVYGSNALLDSAFGSYLNYAWVWVFIVIIAYVLIRNKHER